MPSTKTKDKPRPIIPTIDPQILEIEHKIKSVTSFFNQLRQEIKLKKYLQDITRLQVAMSTLDRASEELQRTMRGETFPYDD